MLKRYLLLLSIPIIGGCAAMTELSRPGRLAPEDITLDKTPPYPTVACTPAELERLRAAYRGAGPAREVVAKRIERADAALQRDVDFPPEGGQHNQWYQCERCQIALQTVDDTHHRCPQCDSVYSGYPYDNVIYSRRHHALTRDMEECAWAYAVTGEERYARRTRDILVGYAERYAAYPYHSASMGKRTDEPARSGGHVFEQTLDEASWSRPICEAYDLTRTSAVYSNDDHRKIRDDLFRKVYANIDQHRAGKSNWQTYHNSAFLYIGGVLDDEALVRQAILDPENGYYHQMDISVLPGGMWYENSWSYHFYTLEAMRRIVETARRLGIDLYTESNLKEMYTVGIDYLMPDGTLPRFGDAVTSGIPGARFESAYNRWPESRILAVLPEKPTWDSILYGRTEKPGDSQSPANSILVPGPGHAILRADGSEGRSSAVLSFGPFGGFHGHFDKLSFVYFGMDRELGYDPGRSRSQAYRLPVHRNWYRATTSHNAVLVDRASQEGAAGRCDLFLAAPDLSAAAASTDEAYPGILHRRLLILRPGYLIATDLLDASDGREHTFDWLYHNRGQGVSSPDAGQEGEAPEGQGFEYIQDIRRGTTGDPIRATFTSGEGRVHLLCDGQQNSDLFTGTGVGESVLDRIPLLCVTRRGTAARYAAAIDPTRKDAPAEVEAISIADHPTGGYLIRLALRGDVEELYAWDPESVERKIEGIETSSVLLCLRREQGSEWKVLAEAITPRSK